MLAWILNGYPSALASTHRVLTGLQPRLASLVRVETQSWSSDDQAIPDLIGIGRDGTTPLVVEVKFDATLTPNQPVTYLDRLSATTANGCWRFWYRPGARNSSGERSGVGVLRLIVPFHMAMAPVALWAQQRSASSPGLSC